MSSPRPQLTRQEFLACFQTPMSDVTSFQEPATDIWPYVALIDPGDIGVSAIHDVDYVYRHPSGRYDHVLLATDRADVFLAILVDRQDIRILGHRLLDLPAEYELAAKSTKARDEMVPSPRLLDQRLRNRVMEVAEMLADGDETVRLMGTTDYFERFYDFVPHRDDGVPFPNDAMTADEHTALQRLSKVMDDACDDAGGMEPDEFIDTGWPARVQTIARALYELMARRGKFSDDIEEQQPSSLRN